MKIQQNETTYYSLVARVQIFPSMSSVKLNGVMLLCMNLWSRLRLLH
jgi:hypothetical protein